MASALQPLTIGFVGCGLIAAHHARNLAAVDGVAIGAVHDLDPERATRFATDHGGRVVDDQAAVIAASDAVYVCTWTAAHPPTVGAAAAAGRPVFCEKPLATDLTTATAMAEVVARAGVVNQVGLVLRHSPAFRWLRHQVAEPEAGPVMSVVFRDDQYLPVQGLYGSTWRADRSRAGAGTLLEHSIHDLDLLTWMLGPIESVTARTSHVHELDGIEDQATVVLEAAAGAHAVLSSTWHDVLSRPSQRRVEVFCRNRVLTLAGDWSGPVTVEDESGTHSWAGDELAAVVAAVDGRGTNPDADFVAAVRSGTAAGPDFPTAVVAHRLADAAYRSAAAGGLPVVVSR